MSLGRRFVLLDRDGTLNIERDYLSRPEQVELIAGVAAGIRDLRAAGFGVAVISNQSGIGRGYFTLETLALIHARIDRLLELEGTKLDGIYFCPHLPADDCACRKPKSGMILQAAQEMGFDPAESFVVGDKEIDVKLGRNVGATTFLVRTGYGRDYEAATEANYVVDAFGDAAAIILDLSRDERRTAGPAAAC